MADDPTIHHITTPPSTGPAVSALAIPGVVVNDEWAGGSPGGMALNVSCTQGSVSMGGVWSNSINLGPLTLVDLNARLAQLHYVPPFDVTITEDTIYVDVWNQAGYNYGIHINVTVTTTAPAMRIATIAGKTVGSEFPVVGSLAGYGAIPALQYQDHATSGVVPTPGWTALPNGSSVSATDFSFTHPLVTGAAAGMTVAVRDAGSPTVNATSNSFAVTGTPPPPVVTLTGITLSGLSVAAGAAIGTPVGVIAVLASGGSFTGTLALAGADAASFTLSGTTLLTAALLSARGYAVSVVATMTGAVGSPLTHAFTVTAAGGLRASRVADWLETIGSNFFPNGQDGSGAAGTNTAAAFITMIDYLTAGTGMGFIGRIYDRADSDQTVIPRAVSAARPAVKWVPCFAQGSTITSIVAANDRLFAAGCLAFGEGANEPGNSLDGGGTALAPSAALAVQQAIYADLHPKGVLVADASLNDTGSNTYPNDYWGSTAAAQKAVVDLFVGHDYPNSGAPSRDMWRRAGLFTSEGWPVPGVITEFHSVLYNSHTKDLTTAAYYTICAWLAGFKYHHLQALIYFSDYDYAGAFATPVGLFLGQNPATPSLVAKAIRNCFNLCQDSGLTRRSFSPPARNITVSGLPAAWAGNQGGVASGGGHWHYFAGTDGNEYIVVWNEQDDLDLTTTHTVTVDLGSVVASVIDKSVTNPMTDTPAAIQTLNNVSSVTMQLVTEVRVLKLVSSVSHPPSAPTLFGSVVDQNNVSLSWSVPTGAAPFSYAVQYRVTGQTAWTPGQTVSVTSTTVSGLAENTAYDFRIVVSNSNGTNVSNIVAVTTATAPVRSGGFTIGTAVATPTTGAININLTAQTGLMVGEELFGVSQSTSNATWSGSFADSSWVSTMATLDIRSWRLQSEDLIANCFTGPNDTGAGNFSVLAPLVANINTAFPNAKKFWTLCDPNFAGAWATGVQSNPGNVAAQMVKLANYLESQGIHIDYWDLFNEPDGAGAVHATEAQCQAGCAAIFPALNALGKGYKFGSSPPTSPFVGSYAQACVDGYPAMDYISGHWYAGEIDAGSKAYDLALAGPGGPAWTAANVLNTGSETFNGRKLPYALTEYGLGWSGNNNAFATNMVASVTWAAMCANGALQNALWEAGMWDGAQASYGFANSLGAVAPHVYMLSQCGQHLPGAIVVSNVGNGWTYSANRVGTGGGGPELTVLATTNGILVVNSGPTSSTGSITVAVGGLLNTTLQRWQQVATGSDGSFSTNAGTTSTVSVTGSGATATIAGQSFPALSVTVYYP